MRDSHHGTQEVPTAGIYVAASPSAGAAVDSDVPASSAVPQARRCIARRRHPRPSRDYGDSGLRICLHDGAAQGPSRVARVGRRWAPHPRRDLVRHPRLRHRWPTRPCCVPRSTASLIGSSRGLKKFGEPINGVLVEDELIAQAMRACLDLASGCPSEERREAWRRPPLGRDGGQPSDAAACCSGDLGFERPDRPPAFGRARASSRRRQWSGSVRSALPWPFESAPALDQLDRFVGEVEQRGRCGRGRCGCGRAAGRGVPR